MMPGHVTLNEPLTHHRQRVFCAILPRMVRFFNTTGPCDPARHYMLPPAARLVGAQLDRYIGNQLYWVLHAPRQTGKTTFLWSWMKEINAGDEAVACYVTVERAQGIPEPERAMPAICESIRESALAFLGESRAPEIPMVSPLSQLSVTLKHGLTQIERYRDLIDPTAPAHLIVSDRTPAGRERSWEERLSWETRQTAAGTVTAVGGARAVLRNCVVASVRR